MTHQACIDHFILHAEDDVHGFWRLVLVWQEQQQGLALGGDTRHIDALGLVILVYDVIS